METTSTMEKVLQDFVGLGVGLVVDRFGSGYSLLMVLKRFPLTGLKIAPSFVADLGEVAQGGEAENQRAELLAQGCEIGQGIFSVTPKRPGRWCGI